MIDQILEKAGMDVEKLNAPMFSTPITNNYAEMCMASPIQKTRKFLTPGTHVFTEVTYKDKHYTWTRVIILDDKENDGKWALTQEDWQRLYERYKVANTLEKFYNDYFECIVDAMENTERTSVSDTHSIAWCLYVHKEVYGLSWDWKKKQWVKQ